MVSDFTDGEKANFTSGFVLSRNLYWNAGKSIPADGGSVFKLPDDDPKGIYENPRLPDPAGAVLPRFDFAKGRFLSGRRTIQGEFERLVRDYGTPAKAVVGGRADPAAIPDEDILGNKRGSSPDLGALQQ